MIWKGSDTVSHFENGELDSVIEKALNKIVTVS